MRHKGYCYKELLKNNKKGIDVRVPIVFNNFLPRNNKKRFIFIQRFCVYVFFFSFSAMGKVPLLFVCGFHTRLTRGLSAIISVSYGTMDNEETTVALFSSFFFLFYRKQG